VLPALLSTAGGGKACPEYFSGDVLCFFACIFPSLISSFLEGDFRGLLPAMVFPAKTASPSPSIAENVSWGGEVGGVIGPPVLSSSTPFFGR
jgi:hypothetical protein